MGRRQIGISLAVLGVAVLLYAATGMQMAPAVPVAAERVSRTVVLQALGGTAIQMDVCDSTQEARISAGRLMARGSAGYVHDDGGYRVLGMLSDSREAAEAMCGRLNATGLAAECYDCTGRTLTLDVSGEAAHIDALTAAIHAVDMTAVQPGQIAMQLDGRQIDSTHARSLAAMLVSDLQTAQANFSKTGAQGELSDALDALMTSALTCLTPLTQDRGQSDLMLAGEMRCAGLSVLFGREEMIRRLG